MAGLDTKLEALLEVGELGLCVADITDANSERCRYIRGKKELASNIYIYIYIYMYTQTMIAFIWKQQQCN